mgnify:FL=1
MWLFNWILARLIFNKRVNKNSKKLIMYCDKKTIKNPLIFYWNTFVFTVIY